MKKIKLIILLLFSIVLVSCGQSNIEVFQFATHEIELKVDDEAALDLIYGEYSQDSEVKYSMSKTGIVTLQDNLVTALAVGQVVIKATIDEIKYASIIIIVKQEDLIAMEIKSETNYFPTEGTMQLTVKVVPNTVSDDVVWSLEGDESSIAEISENGLLTINDASNPAKIIVVATSKYATTMLCKKAFYIKNEPTSSISIKAKDGIAEINGGGTVEFIVTASPETSLENYVIKSSKPEVFFLESETKFKAITKEELQRTEVVVITCTSWDGVEATIRVLIKK